MTIDVLQQKKEEVAKSMFVDFQKDLGFLQSTILSFFEKKITQTITSDVEIGTSLEDAKPKMNFLEKLLIKISPDAAEKVFLFIKEKQQQLVKAKTVVELENLKQGIIVPPEVKPENQPGANPQQVNQNVGDNQTPPSPDDDADDENATGVDGKKNKKNIIIGVGTWAWLWLSAKAIGEIEKLKTAKKLEATAGTIDSKVFLSKFEDLAEWMKKEMWNPKLTTYQKKMIDKSIKEFQNISKEVDGDTFTAVKMLQKLDKKLPNSLLKSIDPSDATKLSKLLADDKIGLLAKLTDKADNVADIQKILEWQGIKSIDKAIIKSLKWMDSAGELQGAIHAMTKLKGIRALTRGMRGVILLDLIFTWFDVWTLREWLDEAELIAKINPLRWATAKEHQIVYFWSAVAMTGLSILITCTSVGAVGGPIGAAVGLVLGWLSFATSQAVDIFYDSVEFYQQNTDEFKKQYRTEIKQAVIQSAGTEERNLNMDSKGYAEVKNGNKPLTTTKDARQALIWQEEYEAFSLVQECFQSGKPDAEFVKTLDVTKQVEFQAQTKALNVIIAKRMEYVEQYLYNKKGTPAYNAFVAEMKNCMGIKAIERILNESSIYYKMGQSSVDQYVQWAKTVAEYKQKFKEQLQTDNSKAFTDLEALWAKQPYAVLELCSWVENYSTIFQNQKKASDWKYADKVSLIESNISFIKRYFEYKNLQLPLEERRKLKISSRAIDHNMIQAILLSGDFSRLTALSWNGDQMKAYFTQNRFEERLDVNLEYSHSTGQNIIYRIAKEIHGYAWENNMKELINFFRKDKWSALWLYYSNGWKINNDRAIDKSISLEEMDTMKSDEIMTVRFGDNVARLDTHADAWDLDKKMNKEYGQRLRQIIMEEKWYDSPEVKKMIETNVVEYIKTQSISVAKKVDIMWEPDLTSWQETGHIELPYYLVLAAKKAKIGNLEKYLFKYQDGKIFACTSRVYMKEQLNFSQTKTPIQKEYVDAGQQVEYKQAMPYIQYVDQAKDKFQKLLTFNDNDLDIPADYLKIYQEKIHDRDRFKYNLLSMNPSVAKTKLEENYQKYHDRFDSMYTATLLQISKFSMSNDLDSADYLRAVEWMAQQMNAITIKNGVITWAIDTLSDNQRKVFSTTLHTWKPRGKNILDMAKSSNPDDQSKAIRSVKQIVRSLMEAWVMEFNADGSIKEVVNWVAKNYHMDEYLDAIKPQMAQRLAINGNTANYFIPSPLSAPQIDDSKVQIVAVK